MTTPRDLLYTGLGPDYISRYIALRMARKLGTLWASGGIYQLSPLEGIQGDRDFAESITLDRLKACIDWWYPRVETLPERAEPTREFGLIKRRVKRA